MQPRDRSAASRRGITTIAMAVPLLAALGGDACQLLTEKEVSAALGVDAGAAAARLKGIPSSAFGENRAKLIRSPDKYRSRCRRKS